MTSQADMPQDETYFDQAIRGTEETIRDTERELERLRPELAWLIQHPPKPDDGQLKLAIDLLPSIRVGDQKQPDPAGHRELVCRECVEKANPRRISNGLPPIEVLPGAYEWQVPVYEGSRDV